MKLQFLLVLTSITELISVASIGPFMALASQPDLAATNPLVQDVCDTIQCQSNYEILAALGFAVLALLACSALLSMYTTWNLSKFGADVGANFSSRLFDYYMQQSWLYHTSTNSSSLITKIAAESIRITQQVIQPSLVMVSKSILTLVLSLGLIAYNPVVAIFSAVMFLLFYLLLFRFSKEKMARNGKRISHYFKQRFLVLSESFGGIKNTIVQDKQDYFSSQFSISAVGLARSMSVNQVVSQLPKYALELLAYGSVISLIIFLLASHDGDMAKLLPTLAIFALAGFKLLPAIQSIFANLAQIKSNISAFETVRDDLTTPVQSDPETRLDEPAAFTELQRSIDLTNISFVYPGRELPALNNINLSISKNTVIGLVGPSGSGKSTLVDMLLGLIPPAEGQLLIDGKPLSQNNARAWRELVGYVPQTIYLSDRSISENIAFGEATADISTERLSLAIKLAHLDEVISILPEGLDTKIGERGVQLSGGQRQRVGIARALYRNPEVLLFDEATSALDGVTEQNIMDTINQLSGRKTIIIIAHRITTVKNCDQIFVLKDGQISDQGDYEYLLRNSSVFYSMTTGRDSFGES